MLVEEGHPPRMVGTILDVTERRRAEIEREAAARRLRAVLDQCPIGIVIFEGKHGERIVPNERAVELLGRSASPGLGAEQSVGYILTAEEGVVAGDDLPGMRALRGERTEAEMLVRTPAGARVPVLVSAGPILGEDGAIQGAVVAFENISSLKELERLRIEWSSIVAHDLRQPLNTIGLVARLLARRLGNDPDDRKSVEQIERATRRLNVMIQDLSDLSQLDIRRVSLSREPVDIGALVRASASRLALEAPDREPRVCVADDLPMIRLDADRIAQVLDNLTSNAVKYGRPDAPIVLDVRASDHEIIVSVTSQGPTIPPDELAHVFDRFHRTRDVRRGRVQGLGLGLYIVRGLVEAHGGRVSAESTPDGLTTFRFALPIGSNEQR
jgi:signal transduction histidine kinase